METVNKEQIFSCETLSKFCPQLVDIVVCVVLQEERLRRGDDLRLQMAIEESKREKVKPEEVCVQSV